MARYKTVINSPMSKENALAFMADMRNFEDWDPGIESSTQVVGTEPGVGAEYDVKMSAMSLRYRTTELDTAGRTTFEADEKFLRSVDTIEVTESGTGCSVRYEAVVELEGPLRLLDPVFNLVFQRIGNKASKGMAEALNGAQATS